MIKMSYVLSSNMLCRIIKVLKEVSLLLLIFPLIAFAEPTVNIPTILLPQIDPARIPRTVPDIMRVKKEAEVALSKPVERLPKVEKAVLHFTLKRVVIGGATIFSKLKGRLTIIITTLGSTFDGKRSM